MTKKIYTWCDQCEKTIYVGDDVWFKGSEFYCHIQCLIASFNVQKSKTDERELRVKEKRVEMMWNIYKGRVKS